MNHHILSLNHNPDGRDFIVGDIHGMFSTLDALLDSVQFDTQKDRLISVGDLIDRGAESERVLEYINQPWFYSIMGNHELMCLQAETDKNTYKNWIYHNGGAWWNALDTDKQQAIRKAFSRLPSVAEISTTNGTIGVVHADISARTSWDRFTKKIMDDKQMRHFAAWSRARYDRYKAIGDTETIQGVKFVVVGHTPVPNCLDIGNIRYIDTGATYTDIKGLGKLTMMQVQPKIKMFEYDARRVKKNRRKKRWTFST